MPTKNTSQENTMISRRSMLKRTAATAAVAAGGTVGLSSLDSLAADSGAVVKSGRIQQSLVHWCLETSPEKWSIERACEVARHLGVASVELVAWKHFPVLKNNGLVCAIVQLDTGHEPPFIRGWNNREFWPLMQKRTRDAIDMAVKYGHPNVITFTGYETKDPANPKSARISREEGAANCIEGLKTVMSYAEQKKINVCLEMLNSRVSDHPMKGHPGYQGDHIDYCADIMRGTGSPRAKLLFDIYHVQIMDGDVITRLRQHKDLLGHIHVAGVPGRCELDLPQQEINFQACMRALLDLGYHGYVGQEFVPTIPPLVGLRRAVSLCDV
jgi:hydroxypyruvate isomerase